MQAWQNDVYIPLLAVLMAKISRQMILLVSHIPKIISHRDELIHNLAASYAQFTNYIRKQHL